MGLAADTLHQVFIMFLLIVVGAICAKSGALKKEARNHLSDLLIKVIVPCMIFDSYMMDFDAEVFRNLVLSFIFSTVLILIGLFLAILVTKKFDEENRPIYRFAMTFSNAGYMGFPLIQALFGEEGMLYASAYNSIFNLLIWTIGVSMLGRTGRMSIGKQLKTVFTTPAIIAMILGLIVYIGQIPLPDVILSPVAMIGDMNTPIAMIVTGMILADSKLGNILRSGQVYVTIAMRLLIIPAISIAIASLLHLSGMAAEVVLILEACPVASISSVFALQYHYDYEKTAGCVIVSTILSIVTLPVMALLISSIM